MSVVAAAVVGSTIVGAVVATQSAKAAGKSAKYGTDTAAAAQVESTEMQVEEIRRQFDYQTNILQPLVQQQYNAGSAYTNLLGITGPGPNQDPVTGITETPRPMEEQEAERLAEAAPKQAKIEESQREIDDLKNQLSTAKPGIGSYSNKNAIEKRIKELQTGIDGYTAEIAEINDRPYDEARLAQEAKDRGPVYPGAGTTSQYGRTPGTGTGAAGDRGAFWDPNLDSTRLQDTMTLGDTVRGNLLAGTDPENDPYRSYISGNQVHAATPEDDLRVARAKNVTNAGATMQGDEYRTDVAGRSLAAGAAGTGVYGEDFRTSPGYGFAVEEMNRELDRKNSAGGNYGGRAVMEAQRRAKGLADQDYYNWAAGRTQDLTRLAGAESQDAARLDYAGQNYLARRGEDIRRGDVALEGYEQQRVMDQARGDDAYQNYLARRAGDAARLDTAAAENDRLQGYDLQRSDQAYYNYLSNVGRVAGFGDSSGQAVQSSQAAGGQISNAYGQKGSTLAQIYNQYGQNQATIDLNKGANINDALQQGAQNWITWKGSQ